MNLPVRNVLGRLVALTMVLGCGAATSATQTTFFTYQGQLQDNGHPATGIYNLVFALYDDATAGNQVGSNLTFAGQSVSGGLFSVGLDFGSTVFDGTQLWLQVYVNTIPMAPRTAVSVAPVAEYALTAQNVSPNAIGTSELAPHAVTRARLAGANVNGKITFALAPGACSILAMSIAGAQVGDLVAFSWGNGATPPAGVILGPASVTAANSVQAAFCNLSASGANLNGIDVAVQTFR